MKGGDGGIDMRVGAEEGEGGMMSGKGRLWMEEMLGGVEGGGGGLNTGPGFASCCCLLFLLFDLVTIFVTSSRSEYDV